MIIGQLITPHFTVNEALVGTTLQAVPAGFVPNVRAAADGMERIRQQLGRVPITATSWYRTPEKNEAVGGSETSAHLQGYAVDFTVKGMTAKQVAAALSSHLVALGIDQLIEYPTHIHVSFDPRRRAQMLAKVGARLVPWSPTLTLSPMAREPGSTPPQDTKTLLFAALAAAVAAALGVILKALGGN
jgi:putative chitinase